MRLGIGHNYSTYAWVSTTNNTPSFGLDTAVHTVYDPVNSIFASSLFSSASELANGKNYNPQILASWCNSGYTAFEVGAAQYGTSWTGTQTAAQFASTVAAGVAQQTALFGSCTRMRYVGDTSGLTGGNPGLYTLTQGTTAQSAWYGAGLTGVGLDFQGMANSGKFIGFTLCDECNNGGSSLPLQGALQFVASGTTQSGLISITSTGSTCTALWDGTNFPGTSWTFGGNAIIITGSAVTNMNSATNTHYTVSQVDATHFSWPCTATAGTYNTSNDSGLAIQTMANWGWNSGNYMPSNALASYAQQLRSGTNIPPAWMSPISGSTAQPTMGWGTSQVQSLTAFGVTVHRMSDAADPYWTHQNEGYNGNQGNYNILITDNRVLSPFDEGWYERTYGYAFQDQNTPREIITQMTPANYAYDAPQTTAISSCLGSRVTFASAHHISVASPGLTRFYGYNICGQSGLVPLVIDRVLSSSAVQVSLSQSAANKATNSYTGCSNCGTLTFANGDVLSGATGPTFVLTTNTATTVFQGNTFTYGGSANSTVNQHRGQTFTMANMSGYVTGTVNGPFTITMGSNDQFSVQVNGGGTQTVTLTSGSRTATQIATDIMGGMTGVTALDNGGGAVRVVANVSGTTSSLTIITASADATLGFTGGTVSSATQFNTGTYIYAGENVPTAIDGNGSTSSSQNYFREVPNYNNACAPSCGSAYLEPDNLLIKGREVMGSSLGTKDWTHLTYYEGLCLRVSGWRGYKQWNDPQAWSPTTVLWPGGGTNFAKAGWSGVTGAQGVTTFAQAYATGGGVVNLQHFSHPVVASLNDVDVWNAGNVDSIFGAGIRQYYFQARMNSPVCGGNEMDGFATTSSYGKLASCGNFTNAPQTRTFDWTPYIQAGQNYALYLVNAQRIKLLAINAPSTTSTTITLASADTITAVFPTTFAGSVNNPTFAIPSTYLAQFPGATHWAIRYGTTWYTLDAPIDTVHDCGSALTCTVTESDLNFGQPGTRPYRKLVLDANNNILARSDVFYQ